MHILKKCLYRPVVWIPLVILVFTVSVYFFSRGIVLRKSLSAVSERARHSGYHVKWTDAAFKGLSSVFIRGCEVNSDDSSKSIKVDSLLVNLRVFPLFAKKIRIRNLECISMIAAFSEDTTTGNSRVPSDSAKILHALFQRDLAAVTYKYIRRFFNHVPSKVRFNKIELNYYSAGDTSTLCARDLSLRQRSFHMRFDVGRGSKMVTIPVNGRIDRANSQIHFSAIHTDTSLLSLPVVQQKFGFSAGFDSLDFFADLGHRNRHLVNISGSAGISGLVINGERLSTGNIVIRKFSSDYLIHIAPDYIEADSSSRSTLNQISFRPYLKVSLRNEPVVDLKILRQQWKANDLFSSLPPGMFTSLTGTRAEGILDFFLDFSVNLNQPDSLRFNMQLTGSDFKISSFGTDDYRMLNHSFTHRVYYRGNLVASFLVGPENPDYAPFETISPFLRYAVMTSEDGSFFYHKGFNADAFRESIVTNIREGRFARGGSTLSMQLVKNVFLTRNKTIARKIEEALIVWIIENERLVPKQRMYEVYLNIIEWGPGIYGITQAAQYYFNKRPSELTLNESIYLASIVPRPKWFKYTFESNGRPRAFFAAYFNRMKELMVRKEFISSMDTLGVLPFVTLTGPAAMALDTSELRRPPEFIPLEPIRVREFKIE